MRFTLLALVTSSLAAPSIWSFTSAKLDISGTPHTFDPNSGPLDLQLQPTDKLKVTLTCKLDDLAKKPHQAMLLLKNPVSKLEANIVIPVKQNGRGSLTIAHSDISPFLLSSQKLDVSLVIAGFGQATPLLRSIAHIDILSDPSQPFVPPVSPLRYGAMPEITHTFKADQVMPPVSMSILFSLLVSLGLVGLVVAWVAIGVNLNAAKSVLSDAPISYSIFIASLIGVEASFAIYWLRLRILTALSLTAALSVPLFFSGRIALREVEKRRKAGLR